MTDFKRRTLFLSSGKEIKLYGNSMAIGKSLEIGEGSAPNVFSCFSEPTEEKESDEFAIKTENFQKTKIKKAKKFTVKVSNPNRLTSDEVLEIADYNIRLWMELKDNVRKYGVNDPRIFASDPAK